MTRLDMNDPNSPTRPTPTQLKATQPDKLDEILYSLAEDLINYDQRMIDKKAPNLRFTHKYTRKAKQALITHFLEIVEGSRPDEWEQEIYRDASGNLMCQGCDEAVFAGVCNCTIINNATKEFFTNLTNNIKKGKV